jgi:hypothetical protein
MKAEVGAAAVETAELVEVAAEAVVATEPEVQTGPVAPNPSCRRNLLWRRDPPPQPSRNHVFS